MLIMVTIGIATLTKRKNITDITVITVIIAITIITVIYAIQSYAN